MAQYEDDYLLVVGGYRPQEVMMTKKLSELCSYANTRYVNPILLEDMINEFVMSMSSEKYTQPSESMISKPLVVLLVDYTNNIVQAEKLRRAITIRNERMGQNQKLQLPFSDLIGIME